MSLVALSRSPSPPPPRSSARARLADAATELRRAVADLECEDREQAAERERSWQETKAKVERRARLAAARQATRGLRIEVDRKWFWNFNNETIELLHTIAADAKKRGETNNAQMVERHIDGMVEQLERIQKKEAAR
jgi:hypothetical protein